MMVLGHDNVTKLCNVKNTLICHPTSQMCFVSCRQLFFFGRFLKMINFKSIKADFKDNSNATEEIHDSPPQPYFNVHYR